MTSVDVESIEQEALDLTRELCRNPVYGGSPAHAPNEPSASRTSRTAGAQGPPAVYAPADAVTSRNAAVAKPAPHLAPPIAAAP
jgi:hypothetical protein